MNVRIFGGTLLLALLSGSLASAGIPSFCYDRFDRDNDGYVYGGGTICPRDDCSDEDPSIHPGATEVCGDNVDQDCDGHDLACPGVDDDHDGYSSMGSGGQDCNDQDPSVHPGAQELACDGKDNDCTGGDGPCPTDADQDGYSADVDCNEQDPAIHPRAPEICGDGIDQDCASGDAVCGNDIDGDGFNSTQNGGNDCDDYDRATHPGAVERCGDGRDQDCNGQDAACPAPVADGDGDGHSRPEMGGDDCNDAAGTTFPGAPEVCGDGIDQNCDGQDVSCGALAGDGDEDGHQSREAGGDDCDDADAATHPGALEVCGDTKDQDCDGSDAPFDTDGVCRAGMVSNASSQTGIVLRTAEDEHPLSCATSGFRSSWMALLGLGLFRRRRERRVSR